MTLDERIISAISAQPGITDRALAEALFGPNTPQQRVNANCRSLVSLGVIKRVLRPDGLVGNYLEEAPLQEVLTVAPEATVVPEQPEPFFSEDEIKKALEAYLHEREWEVLIAWGRKTGIDIEATRGGRRWIIEVKGEGSLPAMRVNYFLAALGDATDLIAQSWLALKPLVDLYPR